MRYNFMNLSWIDFEDLARDLIGAELAIRFEAFAPGPDGGIDGRHSSGEEKTILQAKHYAGSQYTRLKSEMKRERAAIDQLAPTRYVLVTSNPISPDNKEDLAAIIGPSLRSQADIFSPRDLNDLLRRHPEVEKASIKLWLSGAAVLERVVKAASHTFTAITKDEILAKLKVYAQNPSLQEANGKLEKEHVVIISGPPGVGKTTLAEMLSYTYIANGWELVAVRDLEDGFSAIVDSRKQIFLFDDFLGRVALDKRALSHKDSDLARFLKRVRSSPNARFILTTRAYIFEEARRVSEHLADRRLEIAKYLLDVGVYTRQIKARILYNHLAVADAPQGHIAALISSPQLPKIIDHANYNPRIIEWMTDKDHLDEVEAEAYPQAFIQLLDHPARLWDTAFRHIAPFCQHLLFTLYFSSQYGAPLSNLRQAYSDIHPKLAAKYGEAHHPKDFEEAVRILEGSFITIGGTSVNFVNPSLRDYLDNYLKDIELLSEIAPSIRFAEPAQSIWEHGKEIADGDENLAKFALCFLNVASKFSSEPTYKYRVENGVRIGSPHGLSNSGRMELLLEWWQATKDERFSANLAELADNPVDGLTPWRDGVEVVELIAKVRDGGYYDGLADAQKVARDLELSFIEMVENGMGSDELENVSDAVERRENSLSPKAVEAVQTAIRSEVEHTEEVIADIDSESTLGSYGRTLQKLAVRGGVDKQSLDEAMDRVKARIAALEERTSVAGSPTVTDRAVDKGERFDNVALRNMFSSLSMKP